MNFYKDFSIDNIKNRVISRVKILKEYIILCPIILVNVFVTFALHGIPLLASPDSNQVKCDLVSRTNLNWNPTLHSERDCDRISILLKDNDELMLKILKLGFYIINTVYILYFYKYKYYYLEKFLNNMLNVKLTFNDIFYPKKEFVLDKVILYTDLQTNYNVTKYFYNKVLATQVEGVKQKLCVIWLNYTSIFRGFQFNNPLITQIDQQTIIDIYKENNLKFENNENNEDIRLKIFFSYKNINYIIYFPYKKLMTNKQTDQYYMPFPPYSEEILNNYRNDIIVPYYSESIKKKYFYSLFSIDSKNILTVKINETPETRVEGVQGVELDNFRLEYFNMIKTPFNDFGILYNVPVKLIWSLSENNVNIDLFTKFYLKFLNLYFDEEEMDLKEHIIELKRDDLDKVIISKRMVEILLAKELDTHYK